MRAPDGHGRKKQYEIRWRRSDATRVVRCRNIGQSFKGSTIPDQTPFRLLPLLTVIDSFKRRFKGDLHAAAKDPSTSCGNWETPRPVPRWMRLSVSRTTIQTWSSVRWPEQCIKIHAPMRSAHSEHSINSRHAGDIEMTKPDRASVIFYDADTQQLKMCTVSRVHVQAAIDRALAITIPPDAPENSMLPVTDEDARKLGGMAILIQAIAHPELRERLKITTEQPMDWAPAKPPTE
ncbi:hypothetical protein OKW40_001269 [Paraburkholderia sp. RAU6.4a]